jgi:beta-glucosidase 2, glycosyl-hydrolase family 116 N-term
LCASLTNHNFLSSRNKARPRSSGIRKKWEGQGFTPGTSISSWPCLRRPDEGIESSYPVAVYTWHAANPTNKVAIVSVLLSWTNTGGWFRNYLHDFQGAPNQGNRNHFRTESVAPTETMKGIVFDRNRAEGVENEWDGEFCVAALEQPDVEVAPSATLRP